jgi:RHS repeat-associated protein
VSAPTDSQNFSYDRYGNRQISSSSGGVNNANLSFDTSTNRLTAINSVTQTFDSAGNMTGNSSVAWAYDAENHLTRAYQTGNPSTQYGIYIYDGDGHRARRWNATDGEVWQVYGLDGELLAEYNANASASSPNKEYGYSNGRLLITADSSANINWIVSDHLGTPRMVIDKTGSLSNVKRHDYLPFGEELFAGTNGRTTTQGYSGSDNVRQHFTAKERDSETGLDYFGARYYGSTQGRFTSTDPAPLKLKHLANPQDLNRYAYVANNPFAFIDPDGKEKVKIIVRIFIPADVLKFPIIAKGDGNDSRPGQGTSHRTEIIISVETDPSKNNGRPVYGEPSVSAGPSFGTGFVKTGIIGFSLLGLVEGQADPNGKLSGHIERGESGAIYINAKGALAYPSFPSPDIDYHFDITVIDRGNGKIEVSASGVHDGFPGYEILAQREGEETPQLIYGYNPYAEGNHLFPSLAPMSLIGNPNVEVPYVESELKRKNPHEDLHSQ